jgi:hypothetical protein
MKALKRYFVISILCLFAAEYLQAQFYIDASAGYALPILKQLTSSNSVRTPGSFTQTGVYFSYSAGFTPCIILGMKMGKHLSAELGCSYLFGAKSQAIARQSDALGSSIVTYERYARMTRILPGIRFSFGSRQIKFYNSIRVVIGIGVLKEDISSSNATPSSNGYSEGSWEYYGGISTGVSDAFGLSYSFGNFNLFCEAGFTCQSFVPKKGRLLKSQYNGVDQPLADIPVPWKEIEFTNTFVQPNYDPEKPGQKIKEYLPLSSIGVNIGLTYSFGKK